MTQTRKYAKRSTANPNLARYLSEIGEIDLLTKDKEKALIRRIQQGDSVALNELVKANLRFVVSVAKRYSGCGMSLLDLINEGNIGLIEAAKRVDPNKGVKFISYAIWWIRQAITQALAEQRSIVRLPLKQAGLIYKIGCAHQKLAQLYKREPTLDEVAREIGVTVESVTTVLGATRDSVSIDSSSDDADAPADYHARALYHEKTNAFAEEQILRASCLSDIAELMKSLDSRERRIITRHFGLDGDKPQTLESIGKDFGLTRERIRQIEVKAKEKLRKLAAKNNLKEYLCM